MRIFRPRRASELSRRQHYRETGSRVILSGATASRSEEVAESKDPYPLKLAGVRHRILPMLTLTNSLPLSTECSVLQLCVTSIAAVCDIYP